MFLLQLLEEGLAFFAVKAYLTTTWACHIGFVNKTGARHLSVHERGSTPPSNNKELVSPLGFTNDA